MIAFQKWDKVGSQDKQIQNAFEIGSFWFSLYLCTDNHLSHVEPSNYFSKAKNVSEEQIQTILVNCQCFPWNILSFKYFNKSICK